MNATKTQSIETNIAGRYTSFILEERLDEWKKYYDSAWELDKLGAVAVDGQQTVEDWVEKNIFFNYLDLAALLEGRPADRVRDWRANLVTDYSFREGKLNGFGIGGAMRWRSSRTIGFKVVDGDERDVPILDDPWKDDGLTNFDAWLSYDTTLFGDKVDASFQLNIRNVFDDDTTLPKKAISTGEIVQSGPTDPRLFILSSTFSF